MQTGLEVFLTKEYRRFRGRKLGVLCNPASTDSKLRHIRELVMQKKLGLDVGCFFGPQHGIRSEKQDNMIESDDFIDPKYKIPVFSLYAETREPTDKMLAYLDTFVVDLQDIGTRIYTYMYTLANCMRAAKRTGKKVVVLDRPNPIGGVATEGNVLEAGCESFVGQYPICVRHGMTMGELATLFNEHFGIGCDLEVIRMKGWRRDLFLDEGVVDWIPPSPNIPRFLSALTFPGSVLFEGTNISEARGTTRPFEWVGAPYVTDPDSLAESMNAKKFPGTYFRPIFFQPTYQKGKDQVCGGVHIHVTDRVKFPAYKVGVHLLAEIAKRHPKEFAWKQPPYEYEHERMPIDLIAGTPKLRLAIDTGADLKTFDKFCAESLKTFQKTRRDYLLYGSRR